MTRILSLNIRHGGGSRMNNLVEWIGRQSPGATIITEWRNNASGQQLRNGLLSGGLRSFSGVRGPKINSTLLAAGEFTYSEMITPPNSPAGEMALLSLNSVTVIGCYFPQRMAKIPFFERCIEVAAKAQHLPLLIIGDFNTGRNDLDIEGNGTRFDCADQFIGLCNQAGLSDLWRFRHGQRREWTWRSAKNGFRIDHAFGNQAFIDRFPNYRCEIDHEPRLMGLTDHSALIVDLQ